MTTATDEEEILLPEDQYVDEDELEEEAATPEEGEEEGEEEADEAEAEDDGEEEEEAPRSNGMIPKHRYDSAANRAREAERELAELRASMDPAKPVAEDKPDIYAELDLKLEQARADGDVAAAAAINKQIRQAERDERTAELEERSTRTSETTREQIRVDAVIEALNAQYPELDPDSGAYDQTRVDEVLRLQRAFVAGGSPPSTALNEAVGYVMPRAPDIAPVPKAEKRKTDVKKNVDTSNKQPPTLDKVGFDSDSQGKKDSTPDIMSLSEEEFDALPEATKRKMRGDVN